jgi:hypothetical protein
MIETGTVHDHARCAVAVTAQPTLLCVTQQATSLILELIMPVSSQQAEVKITTSTTDS